MQDKLQGNVKLQQNQNTTRIKMFNNLPLIDFDKKKIGFIKYYFAGNFNIITLNSLVTIFLLLDTRR